MSHIPRDREFILGLGKCLFQSYSDGKKEAIFPPLSTIQEQKPNQAEIRRTLNLSSRKKDITWINQMKPQILKLNQKDLDEIGLQIIFSLLNSFENQRKFDFTSRILINVPHSSIKSDDYIIKTWINSQNFNQAIPFELGLKLLADDIESDETLDIVLEAKDEVEKTKKSNNLFDHLKQQEFE